MLNPNPMSLVKVMAVLVVLCVSPFSGTMASTPHHIQQDLDDMTQDLSDLSAVLEKERSHEDTIDCGMDGECFNHYKRRLGQHSDPSKAMFDKIRTKHHQDEDVVCDDEDGKKLTKKCGEKDGYRYAELVIDRQIDCPDNVGLDYCKSSITKLLKMNQEKLAYDKGREHKAHFTVTKDGDRCVQMYIDEGHKHIKCIREIDAMMSSCTCDYCIMKAGTDCKYTEYR